MATATTTARVNAALQFKDKQASMYIAIGKTSPWTNEASPPEPDPDTTALQEVIGYKKVNRVSLCRPYTAGDEAQYPKVKYGGEFYSLIPDEKAYQERAYRVYIASDIEGTELPLGTYRQVGIHTGLVPKTGVNKTALLPNEVTSAGVLEALENREFMNRFKEVSLREKFIISMKNEKQVE